MESQNAQHLYTRVRRDLENDLILLLIFFFKLGILRLKEVDGPGNCLYVRSFEN